MQLIYKNSAVLSVLFTKNNILCTLSSLEGNTLASISLGSQKTKGLKKITNATIFSLVKSINSQIKKFETNFLYLRLKGTNKSKNDFSKLLKNTKVNILLIQTNFKKAYGGCRVTKARKV